MKKKLSAQDIKPPTLVRALTCRKHGSVTIIMGIRWGDEGKGKQAHLFVEKLGAKIGVRYGGGGNSGHTVYPFPGLDVKVALNHLPGCSVDKDGIPCLARGMVIDPKGLLKEIEKLRQFNLLQDPCLPLIDEMAHVVMPWHFVLDDPTGKIGSTRKGIGPAYTDKAARHGIRMIDLLNIGTLQKKVEEALDFHNVYFRHLGIPEMEANPIVDEYFKIGQDQLLFRLSDLGEYLFNALRKGHDIIAEGHQGVEIGVESIEYPYVTSSDTSSASFCVGTGIPMQSVENIYGIFKAYDTSVGVRPGFLARLDDATGERLRQRGKEYGATTGRPRDCGWLDIASTAKAARRNGLTGVMMNKLDILSGFSTVCLCIGYEDADGKKTDKLPIDFSERRMMKPVYLELPGWDEEITGIKNIDKLPKNAYKFIKEVEDRLDTRLIGVGTGPHPEDMIWIK
jgi:adenylosuccinate synthase